MGTAFRDPRAALRQAGLKPRKELGQNFLRDEGAVAAILESLPATPRHVLEIGPGTGVMTRGLVASGREVVAVETDPALVSLLGVELASAPARVILGDALKVDLASLVAAPYAVFGNIPYHITGALIPRLLALAPPPEWVCVLVQLEVAERLCAEPGGWSLATLAVRAFADAELVLTVPAHAFEPAPKVESALVMLTPHAAAEFADRGFFDFARAVFQERRKQLPNGVANALNHDQAAGRAVVARAGFDPARRPQTLDLGEWGVLYRAFKERLL